ncbi:hypothetical protein TSMEX_010049, partial [Taenia solium]
LRSDAVNHEDVVEILARELHGGHYYDLRSIPQRKSNLRRQISALLNRTSDRYDCNPYGKCRHHPP